MDYTISDSYATDAGTGNRMHQDTAAVTSEFSAQDANGLIWEALAAIKAGGLVPAAFDKAVPATYTQLRDAIAIAVRLQSAAYASAGGTADASTGVYAPVVPALVNGLTLYVRAATANATPTPTFSPNGLAAKQIVKGNGLPLVAGDIAGAGHWLELKYDLALDKWVLLNPATGISSQMPGEVCLFARSTPPSGFLKANGAAVSRAAYASLFNAIGTIFGGGDGVATFNLPDLRGEFLRGFDDARGVDPARVFGSPQAQDFLAHAHFAFGYMDRNSIGSAYALTGQAFPVAGKGFASSSVSYPITTEMSGAAQGAYSGGTETRPRNVALLACIKY
ncbi:phage tail protein [Rhodoferax fermentans]|uniref:Phage tail collar domain-containing protein n=1 Tax=Rhodoferax fermentans TaxID=28066 RepID=A0A1T1AP29_RHOFE|nr:phage tail protein [Rhodoferax fermentans]MBK1683382.1 hypothetical protein [Rhodoferax fermentans]OOV05869.1 hypothetical protein RF819_03310 [Rhodoferax fermentans]